MKIFLSWSGARSSAVAEAFYDWLPDIIPAVVPFYSVKIEKGLNWNNELDAELKGTDYGIVFLTPDNLKSPWIHYEVGSLAKSPGAMIWTFLHGVNPRDVPRPLDNYQHTVAEKDDIFELLESINSTLAKAGESPLDSKLLRDNFERQWSKLEEKLRATENLRQEKAIVETAGNRQRIIGSTSGADVFGNSWLAPPGADSYVRVVMRGAPISLELQSEIFVEISKNYPNISLTGDTLGSTSGFNLFFKEPTALSSVRDIVNLIEKMTGISDIEAKVMRLVSWSPK
jgi:hypothetical protein